MLLENLLMVGVVHVVVMLATNPTHTFPHIQIPTHLLRFIPGVHPLALLPKPPNTPIPNNIVRVKLNLRVGLLSCF